jgi:hypothetical protein
VNKISKRQHLPAIAPITESGNVTKIKRANITKIVLTGKAAVDVFIIATEFTKLNTIIRGTFTHT